MAKMNRFTQRVAMCGMLAALIVPASTLAHSTRATMDPSGNSATFTGLARITCFDDGGGPTAHLMVRVRDNSPPVAGLLVNLQVLKGTSAISISDTVSGDANYSDYILLSGGNGEYLAMVNKTAAGPRTFDIEWHCMAADGQHTGTEIIVHQFR